MQAAAIDELIHGSTIAINTLIERKGAKTGLIVTSGTRDVYIIGRGNRPEAYNLFFHRHQPLVPRHLTREVEERLTSAGRGLPAAEQGERHRSAAARSPPKASRRSRCAFCTPTPIPTTNASPAPW